MSTAAAPSTSSPSSPLRLDGNVASAAVRESIKSEVSSLLSASSSSSPPLPPPSLAVILVGTRKDSQTYVNAKTKACKECGIVPHQYNLEESTTQEQLLELVQKLNNDSSIHGILIQLPLPSHCNSTELIATLSPSKDVDGLTSMNAGDLLRCGSSAHLIACTPLGCMELLKHYNISIEGKYAVVVGRSDLVGKPIAQLLLSQNATVTICHSKTKNLPAILQQADIVIAAIGKPEYVRGEWVKPDCVIVDVGINAKPDESKKLGYRLVGDVAFDECVKQGVSAISPVPGGVGPMTVAMLMKNTLKAWKRQTKLEK